MRGGDGRQQLVADRILGAVAQEQQIECDRLRATSLERVDRGLPEAEPVALRADDEGELQVDASGGELGGGELGSGVGWVGADTVGGTPGVATGGAPASGTGPAGWIGRPCLSYSTAGPLPSVGPPWVVLILLCASSSLAWACSAIFLALSMNPMVSLSSPPRTRRSRGASRTP